jgi:hypothetical protein
MVSGSWCGTRGAVVLWPGAVDEFGFGTVSVTTRAAPDATRRWCSKPNAKCHSPISLITKSLCFVTAFTFPNPPRPRVRSTEKCVMSISSGLIMVTFPVDPQPPMVEHTAQWRVWSNLSVRSPPLDRLRSIPGLGFARGAAPTLPAPGSSTGCLPDLR